jgi:hypothetical protein
MNNTTNDDGNNKLMADPLVMFPSSKNFEIEDERDPLKELLTEFDEYGDCEDSFDEDKTYIKKLPELNKHRVEDYLELMDKFNFYLSEIDQYWHE